MNNYIKEIIKDKRIKILFITFFCIWLVTDLYRIVVLDESLLILLPYFIGIAVGYWSDRL